MSEQALHSKRPWRAVLARRRWRSGYNAGGSPAYIGNYDKITSCPNKSIAFIIYIYSHSDKCYTLIF